MAITIRLASGPGDVRAAQAHGQRRVRRDGPDADGRFTDHYECGCRFHGRVVTEGHLRGHAYGDGSEEMCPAHAFAEPDED